MERLLRDPQLGRRLRAAGIERARAYSWESSARILSSLFDELVGHGAS
jgi:glycosyltransferase involved in cell wall biosynthesis